MKIKIIALALLSMLLLVGCSDNSSSEKGDSSESTTTTTTYKNISFEATALEVLNGKVTVIESDYVDSVNGKIGEAWLTYDDSIKVSSDIKEGDKIKITIWGDIVAMKELDPGIIYDIKSIEKIS